MISPCCVIPTSEVGRSYVEEHEFCDLVCLDTNDLDNDIL